jgi:protocatechuate 3,4-dioxygenase alpha subunit
MTGPTPGQTVGPFFGFGLPYPGDAELVPPGSPGSVQLTGRVLDGAGLPVPDALLEIWQADPQGTVVQVPGSLRRDGWTFTGFGRCGTDAAGRYSFTTVLPRPTAPGRRPFFAITLFARGLLDRLFTRAYLPADDSELAADPLLATVPAPRRRTLVIEADGPRLEFDIRLQGEDETVFLHFRDDG